MQKPLAVLLRVDEQLLAAHRAVFGTTRTEQYHALADGLASSPRWAEVANTAHLVVRADAGILGVIGYISPSNRAFVEALGRQVEHLLRTLLPVPYAEVDAATRDLALMIHEHLSDAELSDASLKPIPRGGLIVAGLLAYALKISPSRIGDRDAQGITLLIDDCALSGTRLGDWLERTPGEVGIALLHAHPDLCRRVARSQPRVRFCVAARPLRDHALNRSDYAAWRRRWKRRRPREYWTGDPDHVCYPWNEPDAVIWNRAARRAEAGWHVVPPDWCLKNDDVHRRGTGVQRCVTADGPLRPRPDVVWAQLPDTLVVARLGDQRAYALRGSAAAMWNAILTHAEHEAAATAVAARLGCAPTAVASDFERFIRTMAERQLLVAPQKPD